MEKIVLQQTSDFSIFEMHEMNRLVIGGDGFSPRKDLTESMKRDGFRMTQPVRCVKAEGGKLRIFDGHNRFATARHLGIPIWYLAFPKGHAITPLQDSGDMKAWTAVDRAKAYAKSEADYSEVLAFHEATGIPLMACFSMYVGQISSSGNANAPMKRGEYKIRDREYPWRVAKIVRALGKHCDFSASSGLVAAISKCLWVEEFDENRMLDRIERKPELIKKCRNVVSYIDMLESIYNHGIKSARLYLAVEVERVMRARSATGGANRI